jgi:carbamoyltransferase
MKIFATALNVHDHNTYDGKFHNLVERYTRRKHNLNPENSHDPFPSKECFHRFFLPKFKGSDPGELLCFTCSNLGQEFVLDLIEEHLPNKDFLNFKPDNLWDYYQTDDYYYIDHHQSHATYAFLTSGYDESDILAIDGRGWQFNCIFVNKDGKITNLSDKLSIGGLWNRLAQDLGFGYLGAGKVMGLAGYGKYNYRIHAMIEYYLHNANHKLPDWAYGLIESCPKEDVAFTLQHATVELIKKYVYPLKTCENLCIAGGVAYNGYMNEELTKHYTNVHVPPAAGDEGQALGTYMHANYILNKEVHIPNVYSGREHEVDPAIFDGLDYSILPFDELSTYIANEIANGKIVGWFQGKSESGNRALGNRSILADPRNPEIKDIINSKVKLREDFRPFAPSVLEEHYKEYFDTNQPSPYMSRIMPVISDKIPGVTHVDGTARIQTVTKDFNEKYYNLINEFYKVTGIPMLLNTSFNCQEPIVETPEDAVATFKKCGIDILVVENIIVRK